MTEVPPGAVAVRVQGNEAVTKLIEVFASGFASGLCEALVNGGMPGADAAAFAYRQTTRTVEDPLRREEMVRVIAQVFGGIDFALERPERDA